MFGPFLGLDLQSPLLWKPFYLEVTRQEVEKIVKSSPEVKNRTFAAENWPLTTFLADKTMTHITITQTELRLRITVWGYPLLFK